MSDVVKCDKVGCTRTRRTDEGPWLKVGISLPFPKTTDLTRDACSIECAHWLVDELGETVR